MNREYYIYFPFSGLRIIWYKAEKSEPDRSVKMISFT